MEFYSGIETVNFVDQVATKIKTHATTTNKNYFSTAHVYELSILSEFRPSLWSWIKNVKNTLDIKTETAIFKDSIEFALLEDTTGYKLTDTIIKFIQHIQDKYKLNTDYDFSYNFKNYVLLLTVKLSYFMDGIDKILNNIHNKTNEMDMLEVTSVIDYFNISKFPIYEYDVCLNMTAKSFNGLLSIIIYKPIEDKDNLYG